MPFNGVAGEVYNIGADNEISNLEIANLILKYFKRNESWIEFIFDRQHDRRYAINASKIKKNWDGNQNVILKSIYRNN